MLMIENTEICVNNLSVNNLSKKKKKNKSLMQLVSFLSHNDTSLSVFMEIFTR